MQHVYSESLCNKEYRPEISQDVDFSVVFETYYKRVYNYIFYRVYSSHVAEDITSRVFENAMKKISTYSDEKAPFEVWMFAIARNLVNDYFRTLEKRKTFSLDTIREIVSRKKDPERLIIKGEESSILFKALGTLNVRERNIISLKFGAALKNKEIAKIMNMSENNIGIILFRAIKKLRNELGDGVDL